MSTNLCILRNQLRSTLKQAQQTLESLSLTGTTTTTTTTTNNNVINSSRRTYNTTTRTTTRRKQSKESLYTKLSPLGHPGISIKPVLDNWVDNGSKVCVAELLRIIHDFRKRNRYTHALEVSEWMDEKGICKFTPTEHAVQLDLIGRVRGFLSAESYFNSLLEEEKTDKTYGALLNCYVRQRHIGKSLAHLQKMKEMGFGSSTLTYNNIMCLYTNVGQYEKVPELLAEMTENKVLPDNYSYRLCINSYGAKSDFEAVEKVLKEAETQPHMAVDWNTYAVAANFYIKAGLTDQAVDALKKAEVRLNKNDGTGFNHLISLYCKLGGKDEILRLWELEKVACKRCINRDYINVLESLVRIDALEEAGKVLKEWESSDNSYDFRVPNIVIVGYLNKGLVDKAEAMLEELLEKGKLTSPKTWSMLATWYQEEGKMHKALSCMRVGLSFYVAHKGWTPNDQLINSLLRWVGDHGTFEDAESYVQVLRNAIPVNRPMYHALIKACIRDGKDVDLLLKKMKADKVREDETTKKILGVLPDKAG